MSCREQPVDAVKEDGSCGRNGEHTFIEIGFTVSSSMAKTISVCHDLTTSRTVYSSHVLWDEISAGLVGSDELADKYIGDFDSGLFLARGHLAPNGDFVFYSWMDASYHFINVAPQWNIFNAGNWMYFEMGVRDFAVERTLDLQVYTGTHEVCQLEDVNGNLVDIFLYDGDKLPIPRFYWKILYDPVGNAGVGVVGVNNPHLGSIPEEYIICPPVEGHPILANVYHPEDIQKGYMWVCRVEDLVKTVKEVPYFPDMELLV